MAGEVATAYVRVRPDTRGFKEETAAALEPAIAGVDRDFAALDAGTAARLGSLKGRIAAVTAGVGAAAGAAYAIGQSIRAATSRESSLALVEQSIISAGDSWGGYERKVTDALETQRRESGFALDELAQGFQRLNQATKDPAESLRLLATAEDVARARGQDLAAVTNQIAQAEQGNVSALNSLGTVTQEVTKRQDALKRAHAALLDSGVKLTRQQQLAYQRSLEAAKAADEQTASERGLAELQRRNAGQAEAYLGTTRGSLTDLHEALTEIEEDIGGPMLGALAGLAGGLASTIRFAHGLGDALGGTDDTAAHLQETIGRLEGASKRAGIDVGAARSSQARARQARDAARVAQQLAASTSDEDATAKNRAALAIATQDVALANEAYARSITATTTAQEQQAAGERDHRVALESLVEQISALGDRSALSGSKVGVAGRQIDKYVESLEKIAEENPGLRTQIENLIGITREANKIPDAKTIRVTVDPLLDTTAFSAQLAELQRQTQAALESPFKGGGQQFLERGGLGPLPKLKPSDFAKLYDPVPVKEAAEKTARTFSQEFVTHIDVSSIGDAIAGALSSARANISTQSDAIADVLGSAMDERLRRTTLPLTREIEALQASLDASSAVGEAASAADVLSDAQRKLAELRNVYGAGALTANQSAEISDAEREVADAQRSIQDASKQARIAGLQDQIDEAGKAEQERKAAAEQNLADLANEFNRGRITQEQYLAGVKRTLADQQVDFKNAGQLLGTAFADGFRDALANLRDQVLVLTGDQRKGSTLTKPTSVSAAGQDAVRAIIDQIAGGGRFSLDNLASLPKGISAGAIVSAAQRQRSEDSYRIETTKKQDQGLEKADQTNAHLEAITVLLRDGTHVVVGSDGSAKKKTRSTAKATTQ